MKKIGFCTVRIAVRWVLCIWICGFGWAFTPVCQGQPSGAAVTQEQKDLEFADGLYQRKLYENAANQYANFLEKYPASAQRELALFRQGESYYQLSISQQQANQSVQSKVSLLKARGLFQEFIKAYPKSERSIEALIRHGEISYKLDDANTGLPSLQRVIQESKDPKLLESALFYAARCHEALKQYQQAEQRYRQIRSSFPNGEYAAFATYLLGEMLASQNQAAEAIQLLNDLWQNPKKYKIPEASTLIEDAQLRSAQVLYQLDRFDEASKAYMAYVRDHPSGENSAKARYGAAWAEYRQRNFQKALAIANELHKESLPADLVAGMVFLQGTCSYEQKQYDDAILYFRQVIADPNAGDYRQRAWYQLAWSYYLIKDYEQARAEANNLLRQGLATDMAGNIQFLIGQTHAQQEQYNEAINAFSVSLQLTPKGDYAEDALYLIADLRYRAKQYREAADDFDRFFSLYPKSPRARDALVWSTHARFAAKEYETAIQTADRLLKTYPDLEQKSDILYRKALAQYQLQRYDDALITLETILASTQQAERKPEALYWQAYIYEIKNEPGVASKKYGQLLNEYPDYSNRDEVQLRKALCDYRNRQFDEAYREFYSVLFTDRGVKLPAEVIFWMIVTADQQKKHEEALRIADRILAIAEEPSIRERATIAKGNQLVALKQWQEAKTLTDRFLKEYPESLFKPEIYWVRGKSFEGLNDDVQAIEWFEKSLIELQQLGNPDPAFEATLFVDRGRLFERLGRTGDALESFLRVAIIYDHKELTPEAMVRSIRCHLKLNEREAAQSLYEELQKRYVESEWAAKAKQEFDFQTQSSDEPAQADSKS